MTIKQFPIEAGHIMMFARSIGDENQIYITYPQFPQDVKVGETVLIDDGKLAGLRTTVVET